MAFLKTPSRFRRWFAVELEVPIEKINLSSLNSALHRIGCGGLSGGGMRTVFMGGLDERIKCAVCVGFITTLKDFLLNKSFTHTWMTYVPLLPNELDFPELLGFRVP